MYRVTLFECKTIDREKPSNLKINLLNLKNGKVIFLKDMDLSFEFREFLDFFLEK